MNTEAPKYKKYFTLSYDDGTTQDLKLIEILKKYNVTCCTFNINTGIYGANWEWVGQVLNVPTLTHLRFTEDEIRSFYEMALKFEAKSMISILIDKVVITDREITIHFNKPNNNISPDGSQGFCFLETEKNSFKIKMVI